MADETPPGYTPNPNLRDSPWVQTNPKYVPTDIRVGEFYGARSFLVHEEGWLCGVTYRQPWLAGLNKSTCWRQTGWRIGDNKVTERPAKTFRTERRPDGDHKVRAWMWNDELGGEHYAHEEPVPEYGNQADAEHTPRGCACGFHAYLKGSLDFATDPSRISGVVRGWGTVAISEHGFRAQYAEVDALYLPSPDKVTAWGISTDGRWETPGLTATLARQGFAECLDEELIYKVSGRYPDVPIYSDLETMLTLHPTTPPRGVEG